MIKEIKCQLHIEGSKFEPELLSIPISIKITDIFKKGDKNDFSNKNEDVFQDSHILLEGSIDDVLDFLDNLLIIEDLKNIIELNVLILICYEKECNFELLPNQLIKLAKLNISIGISCYENDGY